jgi:segregation and condensation protein B
VSDERPQPFSWDAVAAELAARRQAEGGTTGSSWDDVAARLAESLAVRGDEADVPQVPEGVGTEPVVEGAAADDAPLDLLADDEPDDAVDEVPHGRRPRPQPEPEPLDAEALRGGLEALLFVVDAPVDEDTLAAALHCEVPQVQVLLAELADGYERRRGGITLRRVGEGWRLYTREEHAAVVERYVLGGQRSRLTQAALETLAVVAYRQPVTRARVSAIRGVAVDAVMRTLTSRGLIRECGTDPDTGGGLYATTGLFLERLGLSSLDELPELGPLLPEAGALDDSTADRRRV